MELNTATYTGLYAGALSVVDPACPGMLPMPDEDPTYYRGEIGFHFTGTHKRAQDKPTVTIRIPADLLGIKKGCDAAADFCLRAFKPYIDALNAELYNRNRPDNENGRYYLCEPGGEIVTRNTAFFAECPQKDYQNGNGTTVYLLHDGVERSPKMCLCLRMQVQLPRRKLRKVVQMLCRDLPDAVERMIADFDYARFEETLALAERQAAIRAWLKDSDYCAFLANGSVLPREKGTDKPLDGAVPFVSAPDDEIEIAGVCGMGIRKGVTVITGGGYSGKSTLLDAIAAGIYDHVLGDGRELCITDPSAVTICAEDGRSVKHVNISPFIKWLPNGDTADFSTAHASGSTSQAANIMEAIDGGAGLLLIDEDRSATNFMIRDRRMKELIVKEPITPFTDRVRELHTQVGVSTILVIGGSGEYLSVADKVYRMEDYAIHDVTARAKSLCQGESADPAPAVSWKQHRLLYADGFTSYPSGVGSERLEVSDMGFICVGNEAVDVRGLHDIVSQRQLDALGFMLRHLMVTNSDHKLDLAAKLDHLYEKIEKEGLDIVYSSYFTTCERFLDLPRKQELLFLINRMRHAHFVKG